MDSRNSYLTKKDRTLNRHRWTGRVY